MERDQLYGGLILVVSVIVLAVYTIAFFATYLAPILNIPPSLSWWAVAIPVFLLVIIALVVIIWIGWTMLTTPSPAPLEAEPEEQ